MEDKMEQIIVNDISAAISSLVQQAVLRMEVSN